MQGCTHQREREVDKGREKKRERANERVYVCIYVRKASVHDRAPVRCVVSFPAVGWRDLRSRVCSESSSKPDC